MSNKQLTPEIIVRRQQRYAREANLTYQCATCGQVKRVSEFYFDKTKSIGHDRRCKECIRQKRRDYLVNNPEAYRQKLRRQLARQRKSERGIVREAVNTAIRSAVRCGALKKPDYCCLCGKVGPVEAHHVRGWDTVEALFDIRWVCKSCHIKIHHQGLGR